MNLNDENDIRKKKTIVLISTIVFIVFVMCGLFIYNSFFGWWFSDVRSNHKLTNDVKSFLQDMGILSKEIGGVIETTRDSVSELGETIKNIKTETNDEDVSYIPLDATNYVSLDET